MALRTTPLQDDEFSLTVVFFGYGDLAYRHHGRSSIDHRRILADGSGSKPHYIRMYTQLSVPLRMTSVARDEKD
jgi:hypothetical protein